MIVPLFEGIAQSLLPCSWVVVLPAVALSVSTKRIRVMGVFTIAVMLGSWIAVSGWFAPPVWVAGVALLAGAVIWWRSGSTVVQAGAVGVGAAWAWQPCVGEELGQVLNTAQHDPLSALPGLAGFMLGLALVGLGLGAVLGLIIRRFTDRNLNRPERSDR